MKLHVEHDEHGNIVAVAASLGEAKTMLMAGPGRHVSEVDAPEVKHAQDFENLSKVSRHYKVEGHKGKPSLVRKAGS